MIFVHIYQRLLPMLNASTSADLVGMTEAEIYAWMTRACERLGKTGAFADRSASIDVLPNGASYGLPPFATSVLDIALNGVTLPSATIAELEALSATWTTDTGTPTRYSLAVDGFRSVRLYPIPTAPATMEIIYHSYPIVNPFTTHRAPKPFDEHVFYESLRAARDKRGEAQAPDIAKVAADRAALLYDVIRGYWGDSQ